MSAKHLRLLAVITLAVLVQSTKAAEPGDWFTDLDAASKQAAESQRLVLVHFWAPWCSPCMKLEREVLSHRAVGPALDQYFVRVKLNYDRNQKIAQQYKVEALPSDVIITPQGQCIAQFTSPQSAAEYVSKLTQAAASYRAAEAAAVAQAPVDPQQYAAAAAVQQQVATGQQPAGAVPQVAEQPAASQMHNASYGPQQQAAPQVAAMPNHAWANHSAHQHGASTYQPSSPYMVQTSTGGAGVPTGAPAAMLMGLDGFCPVQLCEHQRWLPGDRAFGAIYLGHTYLFSGPEEKRRFMMDPDRYSPVADGFDPVLYLDQGQQVPGKREHGVFCGGRVYLFSSEQTLERFWQDPQRYASLTTEQH